MLMVGRLSCRCWRNVHAPCSCVIQLLVASFMNTALIAILVYSKSPVSLPVLQRFSILDGEYTEFSSEWYSTVGVAIVAGETSSVWYHSVLVLTG